MIAFQSCPRCFRHVAFEGWDKQKKNSMAAKKMDAEEKRLMARAFTDVLPAPEEIREAWGELIIDTVLPNGVWSREGLSPRDRSLITIGALTAQHCPKELKLHIPRGRRNGLSREEVCEVIMHMAIYGGFPPAVEAMEVAKEVFEAEESDLKDTDSEG